MKIKVEHCFKWKTIFSLKWKITFKIIQLMTMVCIRDPLFSPPSACACVCRFVSKYLPPKRHIKSFRTLQKFWTPLSTWIWHIAGGRGVPQHFHEPWCCRHQGSSRSRKYVCLSVCLANFFDCDWSTQFKLSCDPLQNFQYNQTQPDSREVSVHKESRNGSL